MSAVSESAGGPGGPDAAGTGPRPLRLLFAGTPAVAVPALAALLASRHEVVGVLTRPDRPAGRGGKISRSPVALAADEAGLPVWQPTTLREEAAHTRLAAFGVDAVAVVAYGALIPPALLAAVGYGWINLHFSLLPAWRGAAPVQAAIRSGDDVTGASTFLIDEGLDTGPVYGTVTAEIGPRETSGELLDRLAVDGAHLLVATFDGIATGDLAPIPQHHAEATHAPKITPDDARVDFTVPALAVDRLIRSVTPTPGAWAQSRFGRLGLGPVTPVRPGDQMYDVSVARGELHVTKRAVWVGTATVPVLLSTVQPPGKRAMPAADWARGARPEPGERLGGDPVADGVRDGGGTE